jgi:hypothetical protein
MHNVGVMRGVSSQGGVRAVVRVAKASGPPRAPSSAAAPADTSAAQNTPGSLMTGLSILGLIWIYNLKLAATTTCTAAVDPRRA